MSINPLNRTGYCFGDGTAILVENRPAIQPFSRWSAGRLTQTLDRRMLLIHLPSG
jgi:hypothetical protein